MRVLRNQFFKTKEEALAFKKQKGYGALYSNAEGSRTKKQYQIELCILGRDDDEFVAAYPYCIAWNETM